MMTPRKPIPSKIKSALLSEYNHLCAICGKSNPQVHHIDQNHDNNEIFNLIPLCPNCHLRDQHNPTRSLETAVLKLFRIYKDPIILSAQFKPLYDRFRFLDDIDSHLDDTRPIESSAKELIEFVSALNMGSFYSSKLTRMIIKQPFAGVIPMGSQNPEFIHQLKERNQKYLLQLSSLRDPIISLMVELLRYQNWQYTP